MLKVLINIGKFKKFFGKLFNKEASLGDFISQDGAGPLIEVQKKPTEVERLRERHEESVNDSLARTALNELQNSVLDRTLNRARRETEELKRNFNSHRAKAWMDGIMSDLMMERSKVQELARKLSQLMREKELDFKNRETVLTEVIRRLENEILLKSNSLTRSKEQLVQVALQAEKMKTGSGSALEDAHYKVKYLQGQKAIDSLREENQELTQKFEQMRAQLNSIQLSQQKVDVSVPSHQEYEALKIRLNRTHKQAEELMRTNEALSKRLKEQAGGTDTDAIRERLDAALKAFGAHKAEMDQLKAEHMMSVAREKELTAALEKAHMELANLRANQGGFGSGAGSSEVA